MTITKTKTTPKACDLIYYEENEDNTLSRIREKVYGNTIYTIIARERPNAKDTAFNITKRLIENSVNSLVNKDAKSINDSLKGCNSGGKKQ